MSCWVHINDKDELEQFYKSIIPKIREAAKVHGYAIGVHGSMRRDLDLIAAPWTETHSDKQTLSEAIQEAACGFISHDDRWVKKPCGREAISLASCWPEWHKETGAGHIDLSVMPSKGVCK